MRQTSAKVAVRESRQKEKKERKRSKRVRGLCTCLLLSSVLFLLVAIESAIAQQTVPVDVQVRSPWQAPPLLLEVLESAFQEEPESFFALIDCLAEEEQGQRQSVRTWTDEQLLRTVQRIFDEKGLLAASGQRQSWNTSLALRAELPKIVAFWQLYTTSGLDERIDRRPRDDADRSACHESWVDLNGQALCSADEVQIAFNELANGSAAESLNDIYPSITALDHIALPNDDRKRQTAVLYADPYTDNFWTLHGALKKRSTDIRYVLRWKPSMRLGDAFLTGYDSYLDLKKVDYLVIDDRKLVDTASSTTSEQNDGTDNQRARSTEDREWLNSYLKATPDDLAATLGSLQEDEFRTIGVSATHAILHSDDPVRALKQLTHDFPSHAVALARSAAKAEKSFIQMIEMMQETSVEAGGEDVWMNGRSLSGKDFQPFGLLSAMRQERRLMNLFISFGLTAKQGYELLTSNNISHAFVADEAAPPPFFDASDRIERSKESDDGKQGAGDDDGDGDGNKASGAIVYWNDLEALDDPRYTHWPVELGSLLRPLYPGSFPMIRRNIFNVILAMDLGETSTIHLLSDTVQMATNKVALRWGFVPIHLNDEQSPSARMANLVWLAVEQLGTTTASKWLRRVASAMHSEAKVDVAKAGELLDKMLHTTPAERMIMIEQSTNGKRRLQNAQRWTRRLRADEHESGSVFVNGQFMPFHPHLFQSLHQFIAMQLQILAKAIYFGQIDDKQTDMSTYFYDQPTAYSARSELLFPSDDGPIKVRAIELVGPLSSLQELLEKNDSQAEMAVWIIGDVSSSSKGRKFLDDLKATKEKHRFRFGILSPELSEFDLIPHLASPASFGLLLGGKLIVGFDPDSFDEADYAALIEQETRKVMAVRKHLPSSLSASQITSISSIVDAAFFVDLSKQGFSTTSSSSARTAVLDKLADAKTTFTVGDPETATLRFAVLLDPVGQSVQRWSGVLDMLAHQSDVFLCVVLNPSTNVTEMPLKRYYRSSAPFQLQFDRQGKVQSSQLSFYGLPQDAVLTMGLDAPPAWLTMPIEAIYDLDNIRLRDVVTPTVRAVYELKYVLIEGHARDEKSKIAPRGLQLVLETLDGSQALDTIVMANLAYFQFRAASGVYRLRIRKGRSSELYEMVSVGSAGWDSPASRETGEEIILATFQGLTLFPRMNRRAGKEGERLVEDEEASASAVTRPSSPASSSSPSSSFSSSVVARFDLRDMFEENRFVKSFLQRAQNVFSTLGKNAGGRLSKEQTTKQASINVFTVASGHLYERMTYIMILSTLKNTEHSVKFWFIENFLSPSFKSFIPLLAKEYKFEYELITYAWPHWLRPQREKQREIWGMKVLFLDVLFPLNLTNVIFVDADQIVRADLMELVETDLQGAPYGFAPMGNDSYDMDNFRFWESGYWEKFLRGKPYPISALFVVDLNRFRLVAAGDKMRGHYQALSADPGSLSNLDQDLVASMIHTVPIFSLPREWLWCETWCSWQWYHEAKSIDLCSNPKTHEPKLDRARRQIPEWTILDDEVASFARRLEQEGALGTNVVAASAATTSDANLMPDHASAPLPAHNAHDEL